MPAPSKPLGALAPVRPGSGGAAAPSAGAPSPFAQGVALIGRGDYAAGAEQLAEFSDRSPGDARAEDAAFLAVVALQRAGRREAAAEAARRYLARYPNGYRRAEAEAIAAGR